MNAPKSPYAEAYRLIQAGRVAEALPFAGRAAHEFNIALPAHGMFAKLLLQADRREEAETVVRRALECPSGSADAYDGLAHASLLLGWHDRSNELYRRVVRLAPKTAQFWYNLASSERSFGRLDESESACDRAIALDPTQYPSFWLRSELRVQTTHSNHIKELQLLRNRSTTDGRGRLFLSYALGKELDDLQQFDEAFQCFSAGATLRRRSLAYDVTIDEKKMQRIREVFNAKLVRQTTTSHVSSRYIFIVGLPRSGTTLVERILLGLAGVCSNGETENFARALLSAAASGHDDIFARAAAADPQLVALQYKKFADLNGEGERVIEKLPMNYLYLGAIHRALPDAKIILVKRSPIDNCFAMYRTLFGEAYPFSYDFADLARYYAAYNALISHWRDALVNEVYEVTYEELVAEPLRLGAAIARHCELPWSPKAINIEDNPAVSFTASASQIRRPIYNSSVARWKHYRSHLIPLSNALRDRGVSIPEMM